MKIFVNKLFTVTSDPARARDSVLAACNSAIAQCSKKTVSIRRILGSLVAAFCACAFNAHLHDDGPITAPSSAR